MRKNAQKGVSSCVNRPMIFRFFLTNRDLNLWLSGAVFKSFFFFNDGNEDSLSVFFFTALYLRKFLCYSQFFQKKFKNRVCLALSYLNLMITHCGEKRIFHYCLCALYGAFILKFQIGNVSFLSQTSAFKCTSKCRWSIFSWQVGVMTHLFTTVIVKS